MIALQAMNFKLGLWTFLHVPAHMITVGDFQSDWRKCNPIKKLKGQRGR